MEFVAVPPGEFTMGCSPGDSECDDDEKPSRRVRITEGFEMGKYEVTQTEWEAVTGSNPSYFKGADRPVEMVRWNDIQEFLAKLNARNDGRQYRLPTEAEWEYAARAGTTGKYAGELDDMAWYYANSGGETHPVGQKQPNAWGLYDMHGNVWEWCRDWYDKDYYGRSLAVDPQGPSSGSSRVMRGGSWNYNARFHRVSRRDRFRTRRLSGSHGLRCARERK